MVAFNAIPWLLMIAVLLVVSSEFTERVIEAMPRPLQRPLRRLLRIAPPLGLGETFGGQ